MFEKFEDILTPLGFVGSCYMKASGMKMGICTFYKPSMVRKINEIRNNFYEDFNKPASEIYMITEFEHLDSKKHFLNVVTQLKAKPIEMTSRLK